MSPLPPGPSPTPNVACGSHLASPSPGLPLGSCVGRTGSQGVLARRTYLEDTRPQQARPSNPPQTPPVRTQGWCWLVARGPWYRSRRIDGMRASGPAVRMRDTRCFQVSLDRGGRNWGREGRRPRAGGDSQTLPELRTHPCCCPAVWPWTGDSTSLSSRCLLCTVGVVTAGIVRDTAPQVRAQHLALLCGLLPLSHLQSMCR